MVLLKNRHSTKCALLTLCTLLMLGCAFMAQARPLTPEERQQRDVNPFPNEIPTTDSDSKASCYKQIVETFENGTQSRTVNSNECCDGYTGENCDEKKPVPSSEVEFDPVDPCKNLECRGVEGAQCVTISKCDERWPVFLMNDGSLAECTNGQPVNITKLTCMEQCAVDPCAGQTCAMHPDAFCVHTACHCNEPMWLLDTGVQVDCDTGELLSPEEAKSRRRRKRQAATSTPPPASTCL